jgi:hypothetical protein
MKMGTTRQTRFVAHPVQWAGCAVRRASAAVSPTSREVLGNQIYELLARKGETMTSSAMVTTHTTKSTRPKQH